MDMNQPIFPAPPGYVVDLVNPQRTGEAANFWVGTLGMIVSTIFVVIRVYTKTLLAKNFTADDGKPLPEEPRKAYGMIGVSNKTNSGITCSLGKLHQHQKIAGYSTRRANDRYCSASLLPYKSLSYVRFQIFTALIRDLTTPQSNMAEALSACTSGN